MNNIIDINEKKKARPSRELPGLDAGGTRTLPILDGDLDPDVKALFENRNDETNGKLDRIWFSWPTLEDATRAFGKYVTALFPMPDGNWTLMESTIRNAVAAYDASMRADGDDMSAMMAYIGALLDAATVMISTAVHVGRGNDTRLWTPFRLPLAEFARMHKADKMYFRSTCNYEFMRDRCRHLLAVQILTAGELALVKQHRIVE